MACGTAFWLGQGKATDRADLGILFVHGIGQPGRGDTLVRFGDPICRWIQRWANGALEKDEPKPPQETEKQPDYRQIVTKTRDGSILPRLSEPDAPPQAKLLIGADDANDVIHNQQWLFAESRWADTFLTPRYVDLAWWGIFVAPWVIASHFGLCIRRAFKSAPGKSGLVRWVAGTAHIPWAVGNMLLSVFLSLLVLLLVILILILAIPPIPYFRNFLLKVQGSLLSTAGDCYVLLSSPIQGAAIKSQVVRDIRWIAPRCRRLAIVAHSQGAAVAVEALRTKVLREFATVPVFLFTFGSGLSKLEELRRYEGTERATLWGFGPVIGFALILLALQQLGVITIPGIPQFFHETGVGAGIPFMIYGAIFWGAAIYRSIVAKRFDQNQFEPVQQFGVKLQWLDVFTQADPVPNGPLFDEDDRPKYLESREIHNKNSTWSDHTAYWKNDDAFVNLVTTRLAKFAGFPCYWLRSYDRHRLLLAPRRRQWRVDCLRAMRFCFLGVAALLVLGRFHELAGYGAAVLKSLQWLPDWWFLSSVRTWAAEPHHTLARWLGAGWLVLAAAVGYALLYAAWLFWQSCDTDCLFKRMPYGLGFFIFLSFLCLLSAIFAGCWAFDFVPQFGKAGHEITVTPLVLGTLLNFARSVTITRRQLWPALVTNWGILWVLGIPTAVFVACVWPHISREWTYVLVVVLTILIVVLGWLYDIALRPWLEKMACLGEPQEALARFDNAYLRTL